MPVSPPRLCAKHQIKFSGSRCPKCYQEHIEDLKHRGMDKFRPSSNKRGYDHNWSRVRMMKLADTPLCERCRILKIATVVHHKDRNPRNNSIENLQSLCFNCHVIEHRLDKKKGGIKYAKTTQTNRIESDIWDRTS